MSVYIQYLYYFIYDYCSQREREREWTWAEDVVNDKWFFCYIVSIEDSHEPNKPQYSEQAVVWDELKTALEDQIV